MRLDEWKRYVEKQIEEMKKRKNNLKEKVKHKELKKDNLHVENKIHTVKEILLSHKINSKEEETGLQVKFQEGRKPIHRLPVVEPMEILVQRDKSTKLKRYEEYIHEVADPYELLMQRDKNPKQRRPEEINEELTQNELPLDLIRKDAKIIEQERMKRREEIIKRLTDPLISIDEAALILNVTKAALKRYTERNLIPYLRTAFGEIRFKFSDILKFSEKMKKSE